MTFSLLFFSLFTAQLSSPADFASPELLKNADFSDSAESAAPWKAVARTGYPGTVTLSMEKKGVARVAVAQAGSEHHHAVVSQSLELEAGQRYRLELEVFATGPDPAMRVGINWHYKEKGWSNAGLSEKVDLTQSDWITYTHTFTCAAPEKADGSTVLNLLVGKLNHDILLRRVSVTKL